jgi:hypothetical protein
MLTALVRESPALEPRVVERLHRLMELSGGSEGLRREVAARLSKLGEESSGG